MIVQNVQNPRYPEDYPLLVNTKLLAKVDNEDIDPYICEFKDCKNIAFYQIAPFNHPTISEIMYCKKHYKRIKIADSTNPELSNDKF